MKRASWMVLVVCAAFVFSWAVQANSENAVEIKGTVFAVDNDSAGNVTAVSILDPAGAEVFVVRDEVGDQLFKLVDKNVKVTGVITVDNEGKKHIKVQKYELFST